MLKLAVGFAAIAGALAAPAAAYGPRKAVSITYYETAAKQVKVGEWIDYCDGTLEMVGTATIYYTEEYFNC